MFVSKIAVAGICSIGILRYPDFFAAIAGKSGIQNREEDVWKMVNALAERGYKKRRSLNLLVLISKVIQVVPSSTGPSG